MFHRHEPLALDTATPSRGKALGSIATRRPCSQRLPFLSDEERVPGSTQHLARGRREMTRIVLGAPPCDRGILQRAIAIRTHPSR